MGGRLRLRFTRIPEEPRPRLFFIETCKLTTYTGDYGAGTTVKTFSLLPGEETEISIKTWKKSTESIKQASSILDSYSTEKADEFENGVQSETTQTTKAEESFSYHAEAEAEAHWGWGSAKVSGGVAGSSNSAREESAKNIMNATEKHAQSASAKRDVNIETSYERTVDQGEETTITRRIKNINLSRTLNFVFRQMNQEFHSILHLVDVRMAFFNGYPGSMREYALYDIDSLISSFMKPSIKVKREIVKTKDQLNAIVLLEYGEDRVFDYQGNLQELVEENMIPDGTRRSGYKYLRVIPPQESGGTNPRGRQKYVTREEKKDSNGNVIQREDARYVDGVITAVKRLTMRTDGVIVEALLGQGDALDGYAKRLQEIEVARRQAEVDKACAEAERANLINQLVKDNDAEKAKILADLTCPCGPAGKVKGEGGQHEP